MVKRVLLLFVFVSLSFVGGAQQAGFKILDRINNDAHKSDPFWKFTTHSAAPISVATPVAILLSGYISKDSLTIRNGWRSTITFGLNIGLSGGFKLLFNRERPFVTHPEIYQKTACGPYSFPSGHTSSAFAAATMLTLSSKKWYVAAPSFLWAGTVAFSRLHLGVHYPGDVLGGVVVGVGSGLLVWGLDRALNR